MSMKTIYTILLICLTFFTNAQLITENFSSTSPAGWSSTSSTWILNYNGSATSNYRNVVDATTYSARFPSAATGNSVYLYIPVTFTNGNVYSITFYTKRACNITVLTNETADQTTPLSTETIDNASCNSNFSTWYSWVFTVNSIYSGSGYVQIKINTVYGGPTSVYLDDFGVSEATPLPITLLYFKGNYLNNYNNLEWSTLSEKNNDYFTIQKSIDGVFFYDIFKLNGAGNSNTLLRYNINDYNIENGINYYRLKQTDYDGRYDYSDIIAIDNRDKLSPTLIRIVNTLGQEVQETSTGIYYFYYSDGSIIKRYFH